MTCFGHRTTNFDICGQNIWTCLSPVWDGVDCAKCLALMPDDVRRKLAVERLEEAQLRLRLLPVALGLAAASIAAERRPWWKRW